MFSQWELCLKVFIFYDKVNSIFFSTRWKNKKKGYWFYRRCAEGWELHLLQVGSLICANILCGWSVLVFPEVTVIFFVWHLPFLNPAGCRVRHSLKTIHVSPEFYFHLPSRGSKLTSLQSRFVSWVDFALFITLFLFLKCLAGSFFCGR